MHEKISALIINNISKIIFLKKQRKRYKKSRKSTSETDSRIGQIKVEVRKIRCQPGRRKTDSTHCSYAFIFRYLNTNIFSRPDRFDQCLFAILLYSFFSSLVNLFCGSHAHIYTFVAFRHLNQYNLFIHSRQCLYHKKNFFYNQKNK